MNSLSCPGPRYRGAEREFIADALGVNPSRALWRGGRWVSGE